MPQFNDVNDVNPAQIKDVRITAVVQEIRSRVAVYHIRSTRAGLFRIFSIASICLLFLGLAWQQTDWRLFSLFNAGFAIFYGFLLVCTHDGVHRTLTGWAWFDELSARLISWFILWAVGSYGELHKLHHSWNGRRLDDPERTQLTIEEADHLDRWGAHNVKLGKLFRPLGRWYVTHQWAIDIFGFGAIGLVYKTLRQAFKRGFLVAQPDPRIRQQFLLDVSGMAIVQGVVTGWMLAHGLGWRYALFWLIVERIVGVMMQAREHLEHYGLWHAPTLREHFAGDRSGSDVSGITHPGFMHPGLRHPLLRQLYATRNLQTWGIVNWLMGGLPYHAVHHAFPGIPFDQLPAAYTQIQAVLHQHGFPALVCDRGYWRTAYRLAQHPATIAAEPSPPS